MELLCLRVFYQRDEAAERVDHFLVMDDEVDGGELVLGMIHG